MPDWSALIIAALTIWGWTQPTDITVRVDEEWAEPYVIARGECEEPGFGTIRINPRIADYRPPVDYEKLIIHEVGHCLGLYHIDGPGIMTRYYEDFTEFSGYDRIEFWRHYPAPYRVAVSMISVGE